VIASTRRSVAQASDRLWGSPLRNLIVGVFYMLVVMVGAVVAYVMAGWSVGDALYMVIVTVYTVGYGEVQPVTSPLLRGITISTIVLGCTGMIYLTGALVQFNYAQSDQPGVRDQAHEQSDRSPAGARYCLWIWPHWHDAGARSENSAHLSFSNIAIRSVMCAPS
jgi:hypothetical protein